MTTKTKKPRLTWRKQPNDRGLLGIGQSPRGAILKVDGEDVGHVSAKGGGATHHGPLRGWYWYATGERVPHRNTAAAPLYPSVDAAKVACEAYVRECLAKTTAEP